MKKDTSSGPSFEEAFARLEQIVAELESGELALEASMTAFEEGMALVTRCQGQLQAAEIKLQALVKSEGRPVGHPRHGMRHS